MTPLILIIDDSPTMCKVLESIMQREGYRTISFPDGFAAMQWLASPAGIVPALILLDKGWLVSARRHRWSRKRWSRPGRKARQRTIDANKIGIVAAHPLPRQPVYLPLKSALRFSKNACMPSRMSSVAKSRKKFLASISRPSCSGVSKAASTDSFARRAAMGG